MTPIFREKVYTDIQMKKKSVNITCRNYSKDKWEGVIYGGKVPPTQHKLLMLMYCCKAMLCWFYFYLEKWVSGVGGRRIDGPPCSVT